MAELSGDKGTCSTTVVDEAETAYFGALENEREESSVLTFGAYRNIGNMYVQYLKLENLLKSYIHMPKLTTKVHLTALLNNNGHRAKAHIYICIIHARLGDEKKKKKKKQILTKDLSSPIRSSSTLPRL